MGVFQLTNSKAKAKTEKEKTPIEKERAAEIGRHLAIVGGLQIAQATQPAGWMQRALRAERARHKAELAKIDERSRDPREHITRKSALDDLPIPQQIALLKAATEAYEAAERRAQAAQRPAAKAPKART